MSDIPDAIVGEGPDQTIQQDMACRRCGYNLRGLTPAMACPECSTPVGESVHGDLLAYADPDWLDTLRRGTVLKLWSILVAIVGAVFGAIAGGLGAPQDAALILILPAAALGVWAVFLITAQDPRISLHEDTVTLRKVVRICTVIGCFEEPLKSAAQSAGLGGEARTVAVVLCIVAACLSVVSVFGEFVYYRRFARRIPDESLVRSTTIVMWGMGISLAVIVVGLVIGAAVAGVGVLAGAPGGGIAGGAGLVGMLVFICAGGVGALVFTIWNIALLFKYKNAFAVAAASARQVGLPTPPFP
ncbi:MAG: hypothetical protein ACYS7M_04225 [Planctomycetota bacterium]|jgi:MFS family permease